MLLQEVIELKGSRIVKPILILEVVQIEDAQGIVENNFRQAVSLLKGQRY